MDHAAGQPKQFSTELLVLAAFSLISLFSATSRPIWLKIPPPR
ncbi:hypothetical protein ACWD69_03930 [Micromonospora chokoriensis]